MKNFFKELFYILSDVILFAAFCILCYAFMEGIVAGQSILLLVPCFLSAWCALISGWVIGERIHRIKWRKDDWWEE